MSDHITADRAHEMLFVCRRQLFYARLHNLEAWASAYYSQMLSLEALVKRLEQSTPVE